MFEIDEEREIAGERGTMWLLSLCHVWVWWARVAFKVYRYPTSISFLLLVWNGMVDGREHIWHTGLRSWRKMEGKERNDWSGY